MNFIFNDNVRILCLSCNVKKSENLPDLNKKDRNKRHSSPFINVVHILLFVSPFIYLLKGCVNIILYPAISTFAVQICYTNKFLLYSY